MSVKWIIIGSGNGLPPTRRQTITRTNDDLLLIGRLGTNFMKIQQILIEETALGNLPWGFNVLTRLLSMNESHLYPLHFNNC